MKRVLIALFLICLPVNLFALEITPELLEQKSQEARRILEQETVYYYVQGKTLVAREILLAAYSPSRDEIELVRLKLKVFRLPKKNNKKLRAPAFNLKVLTSGYGVERLSGYGITRFDFLVKDRNGKEMIFLDGRHLLPETQTAALYFPFSNISLSKPLIYSGARYLFSVIRSAQNELCALGVKSRAYPDKPLCEVFEDGLLANLAFIEQSDDDEFRDQCPDTENLPPQNRIYEGCPEYAVYKILAHLARNQEKAFSYVTSSAGASGLMQFMRTTYAMIARKYPDAELTSDYRLGTENIKNSFKASICLLDHDMASFPQTLKDEFLRNPRSAGIVPVASYNCGPACAQRLYRAFYGKTIGMDDFKAPKHVLKGQTIGYITKYIGAWSVIDKLIDELKEQR